MVVIREESAPKLDPERTALICIDLQHMCSSPGCGSFSGITEHECYESEYGYYFRRIQKTVVPNVKTLQEKFRSKGMEVIHFHIQALTRDGRDRSLEHKRLGLLAIPGSHEAEFLPEIAPTEDEIVMPKTASGAFNCTNIDYLLRNLGVDHLIVVGCLTSECVETFVRDAADRSYQVTVPEDATAALSEEIQNSSISAMSGTYAHIATTMEVVTMLDQGGLRVRGK